MIKELEKTLQLLKDLETLKEQLIKKVKEAKTAEEHYFYLGKLELVKELLNCDY